MEIRALRETDDRSAFASGSPDLDRFFHRFAGQNQFRHHLGVTYVAVDGARIHGFATVAPGHLEVEGIPAALRKRLPRYPLPVLRLARLAVDRAARGTGLGEDLLRFVLRLAGTLAGTVGCSGVVVDAKPDAVPFYERYGFLPLTAVQGASDERPAPLPMFLGIRAILAASRRA